MGSSNTKTAAKKARGRPPLQEGEDTVTATIRLTRAQKAKLVRLGGNAWVRERIDKAKDPAA